MSGTDEFDAAAEAWRKQFGDDDEAAPKANAKADVKPKGNGADSGGWGEPDMGVRPYQARPNRCHRRHCPWASPCRS